MKIFDISLTISESMVVWPGDPKVAINRKRRISAGDSCNVTQLEMGSHTGTHIDAPYHFEEDGAKIDRLDLNTLVGKAYVFDLGDANEIGMDQIKNLDIGGRERVIFKTSNSERWKSGEQTFTKEYAAVSSEAARFIAGRGVKLVGVDYLSVEKYGSKPHDTHHALLGNGIIALEGLNLADVAQGEYELIALPLKIKDGDGSPARAVLRELT